MPPKPLLPIGCIKAASPDSSAVGSERAQVPNFSDCSTLISSLLVPMGLSVSIAFLGRIMLVQSSLMGKLLIATVTHKGSSRFQSVNLT